MWSASPKDKKWGKSEFWGLTASWDPDWHLTDSQKELREKLIELCRVKIRPHAIHCDQTYEYPRESLKALASLGLLGLLIPKELGGLGETHQCAVMITETIARYGCPSTAMVYTMHSGAVACLLLRHHNSPRIKDLLRRIDKECLVGTLSYSDPATGGHFWYSLSSKSKILDNNDIQLLKYGSWATSSGCADWYCIQSVSPNFQRDFSNLSCFLVYKDEVRANTDDWKSLGMHGNQSGPLVIEGVFSQDRLIGPFGDGSKSNDECVDPFFLMQSCAVWNGISLACLDLGKKHVTRKAHADVGMRVCDYPTIQDYFGDCVSDTNASRASLFNVASFLDKMTDNCNWQKHEDLKFLPRSETLHWLWMAKYTGAKNLSFVSEKMLHACGGSAYKVDMGLERLLRDAKAGWVMGPSNEVLRQFVGNTCLMGFEAVDYWDQKVNERKIHHELGKMTLEQKKKLAQQLAHDVELEEKGKNPNHPKQDTDFENPFNSQEPQYSGKTLVANDLVNHNAALNPNSWVDLVLKNRIEVTNKMTSFVFALPSETDYTGLLAGQYVQIRGLINGKPHTRYFSPVSRPDDFGRIEIVMRFETSGIMSKFFQNLKPGDKVGFKGPCGGFEYIPNTLKKLTLLASGGGITPGLQLIRSILANKDDKTNITLVYYSDSYDEILYRDELDGLAAKDSRLRISHTLGETTENWDGFEGFIDTEMLRETVDREITSSEHKIIICGGPTMAVSCLHSLRVLNVPSEQIFIYGQFGAEQMRTVYGPLVKLSCHRSDNFFG